MTFNTTSPPGTFGRGAKTQYVCIITNFTSNYKSWKKKRRVLILQVKTICFYKICCQPRLNLRPVYRTLRGQKSSTGFWTTHSRYCKPLILNEVPTENRDAVKQQQGNWYLSNQIAGHEFVCRPVLRQPGKPLQASSTILWKARRKLLHLMPIFESPEGESDGGYAVSDFRTVDKRFWQHHRHAGTATKMGEAGMYLLWRDIVSTIHRTITNGQKSKSRDTITRTFYMFNDRYLPDQFENNAWNFSPEAAPGQLHIHAETGKWVMTVFHNYQWDLNYTNPDVFLCYAWQYFLLCKSWNRYTAE